jgi:hypothetical protein
MAKTKTTPPTDGGTTADEDLSKAGIDSGTGAVAETPIIPDLGGKYVSPSNSPYEATGFLYPTRVINIKDPTTQLLLQEDLAKFSPVGATGLANTLPTTVSRGRGGPNSYVYTGAKLVEGNKVVRNPYNVYTAEGNDVSSEYFQIKNEEERVQLFATVQRMGYYGAQKPSALALSGSGLSNADKGALIDFFDFANIKGVTWRQLLKDVSGGKINIGATGSGRKISVVSREDASRNIGDAFFTILGRPPTPEEIKIGVKAIQDADRSRQSSGTEDPASLAAAAAGQAQKASPAEAGAYSMGKALNQVFALLGGR